MGLRGVVVGIERWRDTDWQGWLCADCGEPNKPEWTQCHNCDGTNRAAPFHCPACDTMHPEQMACDPD